MEIHEHIIDLPKKVYVGNGILGKLKDYLFQLNVVDPVLVISGPNVRKIIVNEIMKGLNEMNSLELIEVTDSSIDEVNKVEEKNEEIQSKIHSRNRWRKNY